MLLKGPAKDGRLRWYAARTRPMTEYAARDLLVAGGCEAFLPCVRGSRRRQGREDAPLFPSYLFVRYDLRGMGWAPLRSVPQLVGLVAFERVLAVVPDEVIAELAERVETVNRHGGMWRRYSPGETVRVTSGKVDSLAQVVSETTSPTARVRVLVSFLGRLVEADVAREHLQPVGQEAALFDPSTQPGQGVRFPRLTRGRGRRIEGMSEWNG